MIMIERGMIMIERGMIMIERGMIMIERGRSLPIVIIATVGSSVINSNPLTLINLFDIFNATHARLLFTLRHSQRLIRIY
jgi:hypothetical protein